MTGACHHLSPALVVIDDRFQAHKAYLRLLVQRYEIFARYAIVFPQLDFIFPQYCENGGEWERSMDDDYLSISGH